MIRSRSDQIHRTSKFIIHVMIYSGKMAISG